MKLKRNIVAIRIKSTGLGNVFFQYAIAKTLAIKKNAQVVFDISGLSTAEQLSRSSVVVEKQDIVKLLDPFNTSYEFIEKDEIRSLRWLPYGNSFFLRKLGGLLTRLKIRPKTYVIEKKIHQYQDFPQNGESIYLDGTFINPNYFLGTKSEILEDLSCNKELPDCILGLSKEIRSENSVSIHIRRGDFLSEQVNNVYTIHGAEYIQDSVAIMESIIGTGKYYIFSDDIDWVKDNIPESIDATYVSSLGTEPWMDLELMSICRHNIITNSTSSWWGAFRNPNPNKVVVCPKKWRNDNIEVGDMILKEWIAI